MLIVEISEISSPSLFRWELRGVRGGRTEGRVARRNATRPQRQRAAGFSCAQPSTARRGTPILQLTMLRFRGAERAARSQSHGIWTQAGPTPASAFFPRHRRLWDPRLPTVPQIFTSGSFSEHCIEGLVLLPQEMYF